MSGRARILGLIGAGALLVALSFAGDRLGGRVQEIPLGRVYAALGQGVVYFAAVWLVLRGRSSRWELAVILSVAALLRLAALLEPPDFSTDVYRYVWDGRVQAAGINPYRYVPADAHLEALRDQAIYPHINRVDYAPTIYPPAAQLIFFAATRLGDTVTAMKAAMVLLEAGAIAILLHLLPRSGLARERILIYAWHPLPIWEFAGNGHVDAGAIMFLALAIWARTRQRPIATGAALAGAFLVKFYTLLVLPAFYRRGDWKMPAALLATAALAYLPYLTAGSRVLGFLPGYMHEEGLDNGTGIYLLALIRSLGPLAATPTLAYLAIAAGCLILLAARSAFRASGLDRPDLGGALALGLAGLVLISPHYPWYFAWIIPLLCLVPSVAALYLTAASFLLYVVVETREYWLFNSLLFAPFLALFLVERGLRPIAGGTARAFPSFALFAERRGMK